MAEAEELIHRYFEGWEHRDWRKLESVLSPDFQFTSPNGADDKLSVAQYKATCWPWPKDFVAIDIKAIFPQNNRAFVLYEIQQQDGTRVRNTELFSYENGKITAVEVFFGRGE